MAEIVDAAASVISIVLNLSKGLYKEVKFLKGVKGGIKNIKKELRYIEAALKDADGLEMNNVFREWLSDVQELAYDAEDIIDTFFHTSGPETTHAGSWYIPCCSSSTFRPSTHALGCQLENLKEDAEKIDRRRAFYDNVSITTDRRKKSLENLRERREDSSLYDDTIYEHMVGLEDTIDSLAGKLTSGGSDHPFVMSILGMGGLGKTTLARRLYNKLSNEGHFEASAWICVSKDHDAKKILRQLIKEIIKPESKESEDLSMSKHSMTKDLHNHLKEHSFLVVLDDVWDIQAWEDIRRALPQNNPDSRIIITTRNDDVSKINGAYQHKLRRLDKTESWELFCRKSVPNRNGLTECPEYLKTVGTEMVNKCDGLPLALVTLGGLLSRKSPEISEWEAVRDNLWDELKKGQPDLIDAVLTLSYIDLPYNLRRCFLYLGMYPEDFKISVCELMLLWEAEGLIAQEKGRPEDIAKLYFKELVSRSLLQYVGCDITYAFCRIHDLLRDLAITKAKDIRFLAFEDATQSFGLLNKAQPDRRLAMSNVHPSTIRHDYTNDRLRTFRLRLEVSKGDRSKDSSYIHVDELLQSIDARFNLLRVLDIAVLGSITNLHVGDMIHLRYLKIDCLEVELPENIDNLKVLQTISIITNKLTFPETMGKLQKLKHMIRDHYHSPFVGEHVTWIGNITWIGKLTSLETLFIEGDKWGEIDDTTGLVNLRHLTMSRPRGFYFRPEPDSKFYSNLGSVSSLHTLDFNYLESCHVSYFEVFKHCPSIRHFSGIINSDIRDIHEYALNLEVLEVGVYNRTFILLPSIQKLPKLRVLKLYIPDLQPIDRYGTSRSMLVMDCSKDGFAQLQTLHIAFYQHHRGDNNPQMELKVADGGLPLLTNFHVNIPEILIAPDRLKRLLTVAP